MTAMLSPFRETETSQESNGKEIKESWDLGAAVVLPERGRDPVGFKVHLRSVGFTTVRDSLVLLEVLENRAEKGTERTVARVIIAEIFASKKSQKLGNRSNILLDGSQLDGSSQDSVTFRHINGVSGNDGLASARGGLLQK